MIRLKRFSVLVLLIASLSSSAHALEYKFKVGQRLEYKHSGFDIEEGRVGLTSPYDITIAVLKSLPNGRFEVCYKHTYLQDVELVKSGDLRKAIEQTVCFAVVTSLGQVEDVRIYSPLVDESLITALMYGPLGVFSFPKKDLSTGDSWKHQSMTHTLKEAVSHKGRKCVKIVGEFNSEKETRERKREWEKKLKELEKKAKGDGKEAEEARFMLEDLKDMQDQEEDVPVCKGTEVVYFDSDEGVLVEFEKRTTIKEKGAGKTMLNSSKYSLVKVGLLTADEKKVLLNKRERVIPERKYRREAYLRRLKDGGDIQDRISTFEQVVSCYQSDEIEEYVSFLISHLKDDDPSFRMHVVYRLLGWVESDKRSIEALLPLFRDPHPVVRANLKRHLRGQLKKVYEKRFIDKKTYHGILADWVDDENPELREWGVIKLLEEVNEDKWVFKILIPLVDHPDSAVRLAVMRALPKKLGMKSNEAGAKEIKKWWQENKGKILKEKRRRR